MNKEKKINIVRTLSKHCKSAIISKGKVKKNTIKLQTLSEQGGGGQELSPVSEPNI